MKKILLFWAIALIALYLVFFYILPFFGDRGYGCEIHQEVYLQNFKGRVIKKTIDFANHNIQTIIYSEANKKDTMTFNPQFGALFGYLSVGDSVIKQKNKLLYKVIFKNTNKDTVFEFNTACKDSLIKSD